MTAEPVLVALLFADRLLTEDNGKKGIIGAFNRFRAPQFPVMFPPWAIYAAVTNLRGKVPFVLNLRQMDNEQAVFEITGEIDAADILDVIEITPVVANAVFPAAGRYRMAFQVGAETIGSRLLVVEAVPAA